MINNYNAETTELTVTPGLQDELTVTIKKKYAEDYSPFAMIGPVNRKNTRKPRMDIFKRLTLVSKKEFLLWDEIKEKSDPELGMAVMSRFEDDDNISNLYRRLANLKKAGLIRKVTSFEIPPEEMKFFLSGGSTIFEPEKFTYMINPELLKPFQYSLAKKIWNQLEEKQNKEI